MTKDCEDDVLKERFDYLRDYDSLNECAIDLFSSVADAGFLDEAKELFKPLSRPATLPDVAVFTIVIVAYANAGNGKAALNVIHHMIAAGVTPTSYTYTLVIIANSQLHFNFVGYAKKYFLQMLDKGMRPHSSSYRYLMDAIACREPVENAKEFLEQIKAKGFIPDSNAFPY